MRLCFLAIASLLLPGCFDPDLMLDPEEEATASTSDDTDESGSESEGSGGELDPPDDGMSFFVTGEGNGASGGDFGGLEGADARCQAFADAAGAGDRTWRAYLSTLPFQGGGEAVNARDRIGQGPWFNAAGELVADDIASLHADGIAPALALTETGATVPHAEHDILTGSDLNGIALPFFPENPESPPPTCFNWTTADPNAWVWVGHTDAEGPDTWNDAHGTSCDEAGLADTAGSGRLYCFAV